MYTRRGSSRRKGNKESCKQHYQLWTKKNPFNMDHWKEWSSFYKEREDIPMGIYDDLMKNIESVELDQIIAESPMHKATGPTNTLNEMIKNLPAGPREMF
ncbi:23644_t:CDS:1, partial [Gigaspora rosea]